MKHSERPQSFGPEQQRTSKADRLEAMEARELVMLTKFPLKKKTPDILQYPGVLDNQIVKITSQIP